jgi:hypothetical protein
MGPLGGRRRALAALVLMLPTWTACNDDHPDVAVEPRTTHEPSSTADPGTQTEEPVTSELGFTQTFFKAAPGDRVRFTVRVETDEVRRLDRWEWDLTGDGRTDLVTRVPEAFHVYAAPWDGRVSATAVDADGRSYTAVAPVTIAAFAPEAPFAPTSVTAVRSGQDLVVTWEADATGVDRWVVLAAGQPVAAHDADVRTLRLRDFPSAGVARVAVAGLGPDGQLGPRTFAPVTG